jgi:hypothetical protein
MEAFIVALRPAPAGDTKGDRRDFFESRTAHAADFIKRLKARLDEKGLREKVAHIAEPTAFNLIVIMCTPEVAAMIEKLPDVESVMRDVGGIRVY